MTSPRYFYKDKEISPDQALVNGVVRDGVTVRTGVTFMDAFHPNARRNPPGDPGRDRDEDEDETRDGFRRLSDAELAAHRPGWRVPRETGLGDASDRAAHAIRKGRDARQQAYKDYERSLTSAYRDSSSLPVGAGSTKLSTEDAALPPQERAYRDYNSFITSAWRGDDGKTRRRDPDPDDEEIENDIEDSRRSPEIRTPPRVDAAGLQQQMRDHKAKMSALYDELDQRARESWRQG